jgi:hypothetical protein
MDIFKMFIISALNKFHCFWNLDDTNTSNLPENIWIALFTGGLE